MHRWRRLGVSAGLRPFGALNSLAQSATDYKALVCVFLFGGNDANNTLIPFDTTGYANYAVDTRAAYFAAELADPIGAGAEFCFESESAGYCEAV